LLLKFEVQDFREYREFKQISKANMTHYLGCLREFHHNPTTIYSKLRTIKIFFNCLEEIGIFTAQNNPAKQLSYVRANVKIEVFSDDQIKEMLS